MNRVARGALAKKMYSDDPIALRNVHPRKRRKGWWNLVMLASGALGGITLIVLVYLGLCSSVVQDQYAVDRYEKILPQIREENENLKIQIRELSRFARIDRIARNELRMSSPEERWMLESSPEPELTANVAADSPPGAKIVAQEAVPSRKGVADKILVR